MKTISYRAIEFSFGYPIIWDCFIGVNWVAQIIRCVDGGYMANNEKKIGYNQHFPSKEDALYDYMRVENERTN